MRTPLLTIGTVLALLLTVATAGGALTEGSAPAGEATFADEGEATVIDLTFPLAEEHEVYEAEARYHYSDTYTACRGSGCSRQHRATDLMTPKHTPVFATVDGEICMKREDTSSTYGESFWLILCGDDGFNYWYLHLNNDTPGDPDDTDDGQGGPEHAFAVGISEGVRVERGQHLGWAGDSGNAENSGSHLHFEIHEQDGDDVYASVRRNPYASLVAAEERGDYPGAETAPGIAGRVGLSATRLAGAGRVQTAVALSEAAFTQARAVIVVPSNSHAEALVSAPLAGLLDSPILLSDPDGLHPDVIAEIERLNPTSAYVVGTPQQLSAAVEDQLAAAGVQNLARIAEADRYELSATIAREIATYPDVGGVDEVLLAIGDAEEASRAWPDALSASALAAHTATPVLLTEGDRLPDAVADLLTQLRPDVITVIGGTAAIPEALAVEAAELADAELIRLAGASRYATSVAVAEAAVEAGLDAADIWVATGRNFPDALAAGPAAAATGAPLVLIDGVEATGGPEAVSWLRGIAEALTVVGGSAVVTDEVVESF